MTLQELMDFGAPELPEGMYYHVRSDGWGFIFVSIKLEREYLWNKTLTEVMGTRDSQDDEGKWVKLSPRETILRAATAAHKSVFKTQPATRSWWEEFRELEGDHK